MRRILVVDDDLHVGQAIRIWLKHHGFRVSTADSGPGGLAALDNASFDLMIVDVFMPQMRGFEAIRLFHERAPTVPLIASPLAELEAEDRYRKVNLLVLRNPTVANMLDRCAISLPCHLPGEAPVGLMLIGEHGGDCRLFEIAAAVEAAVSPVVRHP